MLVGVWNSLRQLGWRFRERLVLLNLQPQRRQRSFPRSLSCKSAVDFVETVDLYRWKDGREEEARGCMRGAELGQVTWTVLVLLHTTNSSKSSSCFIL